MSTNSDKYADPNPVVGGLLGRFYDAVGTLVAPLGAVDVLDAGCGEGLGLERLRPVLPGAITGLDQSVTAITEARERLPDGTFSVEDIGALTPAEQSPQAGP